MLPPREDARPLAAESPHRPASPPAALGAGLDLRRACVEDVDGIHALIDRASQVTTVLPRTRDSIAENLQGFIVAVEGGRIVGCGLLAIFTRELAEIKSLVVDETLRGQGVGGKVVRALVEQARRLGIRRVFALTDSVPFFVRQGFREVSKATLPHKVWGECIRCPKFFNCNEDAVEILPEPDRGMLSEE